MSSDYDALRSMEARMAAQEKKLSNISGDVLTLKLAMDENTAALREYIELSKGFKAGLKFFRGVESVAVFIGKIGVAAGIIWATWTFVVLEAIRRAK